jgi:phage recombination protein Bet
MSEIKVATVSGLEWTEEQKNLIKQTVAKDSTDDEFKMFLHYCKESGLDPLRKQAHFVVRKSKASSGAWERSVQMMTGVDGFRSRAEQMPDFLGIKSCAVRQDDEIKIDMGSGTVSHILAFPRNKTILGAWAQIFRKGRESKVLWVDMEEYADYRSFIWKSKPVVMIEKTAESSLLRHEYPEKFSGIYHPSEIEGTDMNDVTGYVTATEERESHEEQYKRLAEEKKKALPVAVEQKVTPVEVVVPEPQKEEPVSNAVDADANAKKYSAQFNIMFSDLIKRASVSADFQKPTQEQRRAILILWLQKNNVNIATEGLIDINGIHISVLGDGEIARLTNIAKSTEGFKDCIVSIGAIDWTDENRVTPAPTPAPEAIKEPVTATVDTPPTPTPTPADDVPIQATGDTIKALREKMSKKYGFASLKVYVAVCKKHGYVGNGSSAGQEVLSVVQDELSGVWMLLEDGMKPEEIDV